MLSYCLLIANVKGCAIDFVAGAGQIIKGGGVDMAVCRHVYISVAKAIDTLSTGSSAM